MAFSDKNPLTLFEILRSNPCDLEGVRAAIRAGADVNAVGDFVGGSVLMEAVGTWHEQVSLDVVRLLVEFGAEINYRDLEGSSALSAALYRHEPELMACLLSLGSDPNVIVERGAESLLNIAEFDLYHHSELVDDPDCELNTHARNALTTIIGQLKAAGAKRIRELKAGYPAPQ